MRRAFFLAPLLALSVLCGQTPPPVAERSAPPQIIIKADDLRRADPHWDRFLEILQRRHIHAAIGIICDSLENPAPDYLAWIQSARHTGLVEFWNHGYDHHMTTVNEKSVPEFAGTPLDYQLDHLQRSERLAEEKLGFPLHAFGAPFNATDTNTAKALAQCPDLTVWLYGHPSQPAGKLVLARIPEVNIENPTFHPNLEKFIEGYRHHPEAALFVIQGHPPSWDDARFAEFEKILDFLASEHAAFVTPQDLAAASPSPQPSP